MLSEKLEANLLELVTAIESACADFKQRIAQKHGVTDQEAPAVSEINFNLNFTEFNTQKLGTFEVTEEKVNPPEKWIRALNILKQNNATISTRYHQEGYIYSYWLYGKNHDRIYRQKLKP
jgi:hypothetical protein